MGKWTLGFVAALVAACVSPQQAKPEILSTLNDVEDAPEYLIRLNFVLFQDEVMKHPTIAKAFDTALTEWTGYLPIECAVFIEEPQPFPFMPFGPRPIATQRGIVRVHLTDIQTAPYYVPEGVLGFWLWEENSLCIDTDSLELDDKLATMVCSHELGHVFGLTHFVAPRDVTAITGSIVVSATIDAKTLLMYPECSEKNKNARPSKLEIEIALKNIHGLSQLAHHDCLHLTERH